MKKLFATVALAMAFATRVYAQGTINIDNVNNSNPSPTATSNGLVFTVAPDNSVGLETGQFSVTVLGGPSATSLSPIVTLTGPNQTLSVGPGLFLDVTGGTYTVPGVPFSGTATVEILAWEGNFDSYDAATAGGGFTGLVIFQNPTGGADIVPADLTGMPALFIGSPVIIVIPQFSVQPQSRTNLAGTTATFTAVADNGGDTNGITYQWENEATGAVVDGGRISGATTPTLAISNVSDQDAGVYYVQASQGGNTNNSAFATLTVIDPPKVTFQFSGGVPTLTLNGALNHNFVVQYSASLAGTNWVDLFSGANLSTNRIQFTDPGGAGQSARFYRAIMR